MDLLLNIKLRNRLSARSATPASTNSFRLEVPSGAVDHVETLENPRNVAIRNAFAGVADANHRVAAARVELDRDSSTRPGMTQRVVDKIDENLGQSIGIGFDFDRSQRHEFQVDAFAGRLRLE